MVNQLRELGDVLSDRTSLFDVEELANELLFLIAVETIMEETAKTKPVSKIQFGFNGLKPSSRSFVVVSFGYTNPDGFGHAIHLKIVLT